MTEDEIISIANKIKMQRECEHKIIRFRSYSLIGIATCEVCGKEDKAYIFMNNLFIRLEALEKKLEEKLGNN